MVDIEELTEPVSAWMNGVPLTMTHRARSVSIPAGASEAAVSAMLGLMIGDVFLPVVMDTAFGTVMVPLVDEDSIDEHQRTVREIADRGKEIVDERPGGQP
jgi:hypothetical protein